MSQIKGMSVKKRTIIFVIVLGTLASLFATLYRVYREPTISDDLRQTLLLDMGSHFSIAYAPFMNPSLIDELIGFQGFRYNITVENLNNADSHLSNQQLCLKIHVVYRIPGKSSVYSPGSPTEDFLYFAWNTNDKWHVQKIEQSGVDGRLRTSTCPSDFQNS